MKVVTGLISLIVPYGDYEYEGEPKLDLIDNIIGDICGGHLDYFICAGRKNGLAAVKVEFISYSDGVVARKDIKDAAERLVEALGTDGVLVFIEDAEPIG